MSDRPRRRHRPARMAAAITVLPVLLALLTGARSVPLAVTWQHLTPVELIATIDMPALQASNQVRQVSTTVLRSATQQGGCAWR